MSKQINVPVALLILICLCAGSLALQTHAQATRTYAQAGAAAGTAQNAAIVSTTDAVLKETSELRELSIMRPVKSGAQSRAEIERMIIRNLNDETTPAEMHATEALLRVFGLAPNNFEYRPFLIKLLTEQVAGYYDPKAQQFYLADWIELEGQKPVMAHELTHALQDQHFDLKRFDKWPKGDSDAELAAHALIEGDATLAMTLYMTKHPLVALAFFKSLGSQETATAQFKAAPRALRESLLFPYEAGSTWATAVYRRGGWDLVSKAFTKLPQSTEQIIHPDKYFANEAPLKLTLPELKPQLGPAWKRIDSDVNGEWGCYLILDEYLNDAAESKKAAAGWAGDEFALYEGASPADIFVAQLTAWDTPLDAREFFDAYLKRTWKRYPDAPATDVTSNTERGERHEWKTANSHGVLELRGSRVLILEGVPEKANTTALLNRIWHQG
ncbi:MAG TPA: hypothetical protein VJ749_07285 [Pyrinomonadaceae bacterium]|nr:hypothetical protein [Pyrinomonadaceae bacterium]